MKPEPDFIQQIAKMARNDSPPPIRVSSNVITAIEANVKAEEQTLFYCSVFSASFALMVLIVMGVWIAEMMDPVASIFLFTNSIG